MSEQLAIGTYIFFVIFGASLGLFMGYALGIREGATLVSNAIFDTDDGEDDTLDAEVFE